MKQQLRVCQNNHRSYKSSACPTCPICEANKKPKEGFLSNLSAPAIRALQNAGITSLKQVAKHSQKEILELHGIGPSSVPKLKASLQAIGLSFRQ